MIFLRYDTIQPVYHLKKWQYYEAAKYELSVIALDNARVFFNALMQLDDGDRKILSDVYYHSKKPCSFSNTTGHYHSLMPVSDKELHEQYKVTIAEFGNMRRNAQENLKVAMQTIMNQIGNSFVFRITRELYFAGFIQEGTDKEKYILDRESGAKVFEQTEQNTELFMKLRLLGFDRVPVESNTRVFGGIV